MRPHRQPVDPFLADEADCRVGRPALLPSHHPSLYVVISHKRHFPFSLSIFCIFRCSWLHRGNSSHLGNILPVYQLILWNFNEAKPWGDGQEIQINNRLLFLLTAKMYKCNLNCLSIFPGDVSLRLLCLNINDPLIVTQQGFTSSKANRGSKCQGLAW